MANGKNNKGVVVLVGVILGIIGVAVTWGLSYGKLGQRVDNAAEACRLSMDNKIEVTGIKKDVERIPIIEKKIDTILEKMR